MIEYWALGHPGGPGGDDRGDRHGRYWLGMTPPSGTQIRGLEKEWAEYVGAKHCVALSSGNLGHSHCVVAAGIEAGDE